MAVLKEEDEAILAVCMGCMGEEFLIYEWTDTPWARGPAASVPLAEVEKKVGSGTTSAARGTPPVATAGDDVLGRALAVLGSSMAPAEVRALISTSEHPTTVVGVVIDSLPRPPTRDAIERFLPVVMNEWNSTPRPDLDGRSPAEVYAARPAAPVDLGLNRPCPCGSGKKFKRCCISKGSPN